MSQRTAMIRAANQLCAQLVAHDPNKNRWTDNPRQWIAEYYPALGTLLAAQFMALPGDYPRPATENDIYADHAYYRVLGMAFSMYARLHMFNSIPAGMEWPLGITMYRRMYPYPTVTRQFLDATVRMMMGGTIRRSVGPTSLHLPAALAVILSGDYRVQYTSSRASLRALPFAPAWMIYTATEDLDRGVKWDALVPEGRPQPFAGGPLPTPIDIACYSRLRQAPGPGQERAAALAFLQYAADEHVRQEHRDRAVRDLRRTPDADMWGALFDEWQTCLVQLHALGAKTWYVPPAARAVYAKATEHLIDLYCDWRAGNDHFHMIRPAEPGLCGVLVHAHEDVTPVEIYGVLTRAGAMCGPSFGMYPWADADAVRGIVAILLRHVRPGTDPYERYPGLFRQAADKGIIPLDKTQWAPIPRLRVDHLLGIPVPARPSARGSGTATVADSAPKRVREGAMEWPRSADTAILATDIARMALERHVSDYEVQWQPRREAAGIPLRDPRYRAGVHNDLVIASRARPEVFDRAVVDFLRSEWGTGVARWLAVHPFQRIDDPGIIPGDRWNNVVDGGDATQAYDPGMQRDGTTYNDVIQALSALHNAVAANNPSVFSGPLAECAIAELDNPYQVFAQRIPAYPRNAELVFSQLARRMLRAALRLRSDVPSTRTPGAKLTRGWLMYSTADSPANVVYSIAIGLSGFRYLSTAGVQEAAQLLDECREDEVPRVPDQDATLAAARLGKLRLPPGTQHNVRPGEEERWT